MARTWKLATRGSALALTQSEGVAQLLRQAHPGLQIELTVIKTGGDLNQKDPLSTLGGKGVFVKELEAALLAGQADFAVHSLKDLPSELPAGLCLAPPPERADPRDALVGPAPLGQLPLNARVGTGSLRRQVQLRALRPDLQFDDCRGNVGTRVEKWRRGDFPGGVVLACAGLQRLGPDSGVQPHEVHPLSTEECVPSPCQGILGLEHRQGDAECSALLAPLTHLATRQAMQAERAFLHALGGDCNLPAGGYARVEGDLVIMQATLWQNGALHTARGEDADPAALGRALALSLLQR